MAISRRIAASGISPFAVLQMVGDTATALTAAGTTQTNAFVLSAANNDFTTVAASTGCQIPGDMTAPGDQIFIYNGGANALLVYGLTGDAINNGSTNGGFSIGVNKGCDITRTTSTLLRAVLSA